MSHFRRRPEEWQPRLVGFRTRIGVLVRPANRGERSPESESILGLEAGDPGIRYRELHESESARRLPFVDVFLREHMVRDLIPGHEPLEPEERRLGLIGRPKTALPAPDGLEMIEIARIRLALEGVRPRQAIFGQIDGKRREPPPSREERDRPQRRAIEWRRERIVTWLTRRHVDRLGDWARHRGPGPD